MGEWRPKSFVPADSSEWRPASFIPAEPASGSGQIYENTPERNLRARGAQALALLQPVGAMLGGLAGGAAVGAPGAATGPGALLAATAGGTRGAALGSAGGRALEMLGDAALGYDVPHDPLTLGKELGGAALRGGLEQRAGNALGIPLRAAGKMLMTKALRFSPLIEKGAMPESRVKQLADLALRKRIGPGLPEGTASKAVKESAGELTKLLDYAEKSGVTIDPNEIAYEVLNLIDEITDQPIVGEDAATVTDMFDRFFRDHPGPMTPAKVKLLKRRAQELALPIIKRRQVRPGVNAKDALAGRFNDAIATGAKRALEKIKNPGPGGRMLGDLIAEREKMTSSLIELSDLTRKADAATSGVRIAPFGPFRPLGGNTPDIRLTRPVAGRTARALTNEPLLELLRQSPRAVDALLTQLMYQAPPDATTNPYREGK